MTTKETIKSLLRLAVVSHIITEKQVKLKDFCREKISNNRIKTNKREDINKMGVASLVLGIIAFCLSFIPYINYIAVFLAVLAIVFGFVGIISNPQKGNAIAGLILGFLSIIIWFGVQYHTQELFTTSINSNNTKSNKETNISVEEVITRQRLGNKH